MPDIIAMFFLLGVIAGLAKSDLQVPKAAYDTLSLLLMLTIGLKGGLALHGNISWQIVPELVGIMLLGVLIPLILYPILQHLVKISAANSASLAAHYGSVSAGTFGVALAYAEYNGLEIAPQTTLYLVLLELPAIITAIWLYNRNSTAKVSSSHIWHEAFTSRSVVLLAGGVFIGAMYGSEQGAPVTDLFLNTFKAVLAIFMLEMGLTAAQTLWPMPWRHWRVIAFAIIAPPLLSFTGLAAAIALELPEGTAVILAALTASASYIAAPAAIRTAIKEADIGLAMFASLGVTFPFNVLVGLPLYHQLLNIVTN